MRVPLSWTSRNCSILVLTFLHPLSLSNSSNLLISGPSTLFHQAHRPLRVHGGRGGKVRRCVCEGPESLTMSAFMASQYTFDLKATFLAIPLVIYLCFPLKTKKHLMPIYIFNPNWVPYPPFKPRHRLDLKHISGTHSLALNCQPQQLSSSQLGLSWLGPLGGRASEPSPQGW